MFFYYFIQLQPYTPFTLNTKMQNSQAQNIVLWKHLFFINEILTNY